MEEITIDLNIETLENKNVPQSTAGFLEFLPSADDSWLPPAV